MGRARIAATALTAAAALLLQPDAARALSSRRTPVMGWSTWSVYGCDISEQKIKEQALAIDALGLRALGYTYIDIDDCWQAYNRSADGVQQANASLFPSGMEALADWLHKRGFKLGLCASPPPLAALPAPKALTGAAAVQTPTRVLPHVSTAPAPWGMRRRTPRRTPSGASICSSTTRATSRPARTRRWSTPRWAGR